MHTLILLCLLAGATGGLLQGILGVGTGIIVVPLLTFFLPHYGIPPNIAIHVALATAMATIIVTSIASLISHHQQENIQWYIFNRIIVFSIIGSLLGAVLTGVLPAATLKIIFACFMFYVAFKMLRKKKTHTTQEQGKLSLSKLALGGTGTGLVASLIGAGGAILMVPFLHSQHVSMRYAVGTATIIGLPVAITGTIIYILMGLQHTQHIPLMLGYLYWPAFLSVSVTGIIFAYFGATLVNKMPVVLMQRLFAVCAIIVGVKMIT